jgi:hypothetical protein
MNYIAFGDTMKEFLNFSVQEIEKHFSGLEGRRLVEWQEKECFKKSTDPISLKL